jgi:hypothetical protein
MKITGVAEWAMSPCARYRVAARLWAYRCVNGGAAAALVCRHATNFGTTWEMFKQMIIYYAGLFMNPANFCPSIPVYCYRYVLPAYS